MLQHQLSSFQLEEKTEKKPNISIVVLITSFLAAEIVQHKIGQRKWSDKHLLSITPYEFLTLQTLFSHHGRVWKTNCVWFFYNLSPDLRSNRIFKVLQLHLTPCIHKSNWILTTLSNQFLSSDLFFTSDWLLKWLFESRNFGKQTKFFNFIPSCLIFPLCLIFPSCLILPSCLIIPSHPITTSGK